MKTEEQTQKELEIFKNKFRKNFIRTLTSKEYKIPADTKWEAELKWLEIGIIFDSTVNNN